MSDDELKRHAEFERLLGEVRYSLLGYLVSILGGRHDAEDVLQRASMTMWRRFETFEAGTDFMAWASTVAFYEAKNFIRLAARSRLQFSDALLETLSEERMMDLGASDARHEALNNCLGKLDDAGRKLIEVAYFEDGSVGALAECLGRAPQTLYNKLGILRRMLAECVEGRLKHS